MSVKGVLKRVEGGLKYTLAVLPVLTIVAGLSSLISGIIMCKVTNDNYTENYKNSEAVQTYIQEQKDNLEKALKEGDIGFLEATEKYERYSSTAYVDEATNVIYGDNPEYKAIVKNVNIATNCTTVGLAGYLCGAVAGLFFVGTGISDYLMNSASDDLHKAWDYDNEKRRNKTKKDKEDEME